jgi:quercetin dioxygenase-like cupin family protein
MLAFSFCLSASVCSAHEDEMLQINHAGTQPSTIASGEHFTGVVVIAAPFKGTLPARVGGATVTFDPAARTAWHTHPLGQTLIVTAGAGLVKQWGHPIQEIKVGDTVWIPPGVKHWHGAAADTSMTHIAIAESLDGRSVEWLEKVSDEQYSR